MTTVFVDGKQTKEKCPTSDDKCTCGGELMAHYGFTAYGLGTCDICVECCNVFNFSEDTE